jgi:predicted HAD superfamily Cof-like phosphohydrolase
MQEFFMHDYASDVKQFHNKFGLITPPSFGFLPEDLHKFRIGFFREEHQEYIDSVNADDLGTAFDSLIDLIYIVCGAALLHGIDTEEFINMVDSTDCYVYDLFESQEPPKDKPGYLTPVNFARFNSAIDKNIVMYQQGHDTKAEQLTRASISGLYMSVFMCASDMGCTAEMWDEMWADVQRANLSKERALKAEDSKRGSVWDVYKPKNWVGPRTEEILNKYLTSTQGI